MIASIATPVRVLAACGLASSILVAAGGFLGVPNLVGLAGAVMVAGNVQALIRRT